MPSSLKETGCFPNTELREKILKFRKDRVISFNGNESPIDDATGLYTIVGIGHKETKARYFHEAINTHFQWNQHHIEPIEVYDLPGALDEMVELNIRGLTVTLPHKEAAYRYIHEHGTFGDDQTRLSGAVNTVVNENGHLIAWNTDISGLVNASKDAGVDLHGIRAVIIGAGGMGRAAVCGLCASGAYSIEIFDIDPTKPHRLVTDIAPQFPHVKFTVCESVEDCFRNEVDYVIQCTQVGMSSTKDPSSVTSSSVPGQLLNENMSVIDAVYVPMETKFLHEARQRGCKLIISGEKIVVFGGIDQIQHYLGQRATQEELIVMANVGEQALLQSLKT